MHVRSNTIAIARCQETAVRGRKSAFRIRTFRLIMVPSLYDPPPNHVKGPSCRSQRLELRKPYRSQWMEREPDEREEIHRRSYCLIPGGLTGGRPTGQAT